jgi:hypothetical protein
MAATTSNGFDILGAPDISGSLGSTMDMVMQFAADFLAFIVVAALIAAFAFYFGRDRLMALIGGLYAAIPLYQAFPFFESLPQNPYIEIGVFLAFLFAGLIAFSGLSAFLARSASNFLGTGILSVVTAGFVLAVAVHILPVSEIYTFSEPTLALFSDDQIFFWWLLAPLGGLFFFGK